MATRHRSTLSCSKHALLNSNLHQQYDYHLLATPRSLKKALQTSNPNILVVQMVFITNENAVKLEKSLHRFFHKERKKGEWFENITDQEIIKAIGSRGSLTKEY